MRNNNSNTIIPSGINPFRTGRQVVQGLARPLNPATWTPVQEPSENSWDSQSNTNSQIDDQIHVATNAHNTSTASDPSDYRNDAFTAFATDTPTRHTQRLNSNEQTFRINLMQHVVIQVPTQPAILYPEIVPGQQYSHHTGLTNMSDDGHSSIPQSPSTASNAPTDECGENRNRFTQQET